MVELLTSVVIERAPDMEGVWVAHCLDFDILSQGTSIAEAAQAVHEAVSVMLEDDFQRGLDPTQREAAPPECWERLNLVRRRGRSLKSLTAEERARVALVVTQMRHVLNDNVLQHFGRDQELLPEAWQIAAYDQFGIGPNSRPPTSSKPC